MEDDETTPPEEPAAPPSRPSPPRSSPRSGPAGPDVDLFKLLTARVDQLAKAGEERNRGMDAAHAELRKATTLLKELIGQLDPLMERHALVAHHLGEVQKRLAAELTALRSARR